MLREKFHSLEEIMIRKLKFLRKEYIHEIEMLRVDKQRKNEARLLAERSANEERRFLKAEASKVTAEERKIADEEFTKLLEGSGVMRERFKFVAEEWKKEGQGPREMDGRGRTMAGAAKFGNPPHGHNQHF